VSESACGYDHDNIRADHAHQLDRAYQRGVRDTVARLEGHTEAKIAEHLGFKPEQFYERGMRDTEARLAARVLWQSCTRLGCGTTYSDGSARYCTDCVKEMIAKTESRFAKPKEAARLCEKVGSLEEENRKLRSGVEEHERQRLCDAISGADMKVGDLEKIQKRIRALEAFAVYAAHSKACSVQGMPSWCICSCGYVDASLEVSRCR